MTEGSPMKAESIHVDRSRIKETTALIFAVLLVTLPLAKGAGKQPRDIPPKPDAQTLIAKMVPPITEEDKATFWQGGKKSIETYLAELRAASGGREEDVVLQLMYFASCSTNVQQGMVAGLILDQMKVSGSAIANAALPLLESDDQTSRKLAADWLTRADYVSTGGVNFSRYEDILRDKKQNPPQGLIRYMYDRNAQVAVLALSRVYGDKAVETELAGKLTGDPKAALQALADRPEWWARLYVAETMKKQPQLRDAALQKKLEKDDNPLVKEKVAEITSGK